MKDNKIAILLTSENSYPLAEEIKKNLTGSQIYTKADIEDTHRVASIQDCLSNIYSEIDSLIIVDSMGVCVRTVAPFIKGDENDPAIISVNPTGKYVVAVLSGIQTAASVLTKRVAHILGAEAIITTQSDNLWSLETLGERFGWVMETNAVNINYPQTSFINKKPTALLIDVVNEGAAFLVRTVPQHVSVFYKYEDIDLHEFELLIAVTPRIYPEAGIQIIYYHPKVLHIGVSCRKYSDSVKIAEALALEIRGLNYALSSIKSISSAETLDDEKLLSEFQTYFKSVTINLYSMHDLEDVALLNQNEQSEDAITVASISEATALKSSKYGKIVIEKQKAIMSLAPNDFTFAMAMDREALQQGHVAIVGAGPGDPDLISVKGREMIQIADLILFSESQIPYQTTMFAKEGAIVKNVDSLTIDEQLELIKFYYDQRKLVVFLSVGNPSINGQIQSQVKFFEQHKMSYHIIPGIVSE